MNKHKQRVKGVGAYASHELSVVIKMLELADGVMVALLDPPSIHALSSPKPNSVGPTSDEMYRQTDTTRNVLQETGGAKT